MVDAILDYISSNRIEWLFMAVFAIAGFFYKGLFKMIKEDREKNKAIAKGVEALLRDRIIDSFHKYEKTGVCPIYAKENVKRMYEPYHVLGGNDVATELVEKLLEMKSV